MLMQFARLKLSQPIEPFGSSLIDRPAWARHYQSVFVNESQVVPRDSTCPMPTVKHFAARALQFVASAAFGRHYEKLHIPARQWFGGQLIRCLTIVGLPGGIRGLLNSGKQAFAAEELLEGYRRLVDSGHIVQAFVVLNSDELDGNPKACAPALVIRSAEGVRAFAIRRPFWE